MGWSMTDNWLADYVPWINRVMKLKAKMLEKKLSRAKATCLPPCKGFIYASIAPSNKHIWANCSECKRRLME